MIAETKIEDQIKYADDMARAGYIPDEGPALYQDPAAYQANIDQNLAMIKEKRGAGPDAESHIDDLLAQIEGFVDRNSEGWTKRGKVLAGLAALVATGLLVVSNGGPGQVVENVKTFPQHIAYVYHRYVGETPDTNTPMPVVVDQNTNAGG